MKRFLSWVFTVCALSYSSRCHLPSFSWCLDWWQIYSVHILKSWAPIFSITFCRNFSCICAAECWRNYPPTPPPIPQCVNPCNIGCLLYPHFFICTDSKQESSRSNLLTHQVTVCPKTLGGPCGSHHPPPTHPGSLMRTGPGAFDPAASSQPPGPSVSCLFNNPHSLYSYSPHCLGYNIDLKQQHFWVVVW